MQSYREYFEAEMRSLQDLAQEFSEAYPEQAAMLNLNTVKDRDPYVERLLEGMAFLTSQIRHRLDDSLPEISQSLLEQILPALIRPFPSHTVVELSGSAQAKESFLVEAQHSVKAINRGPKNATCEFKITQAVTINPIRLVRVVNEEKLGEGATIELTLAKHAQAKWQDIDLADLKFYANTDWQLAYSVVHALTDHGSRVVAHVEGRPPLISQHALFFSMAHMSAEDSLLPYSGRSRSAFSVVHDYFCAREKYLFIQLQGLEHYALPDSTNQVTLTIDSPVSLPVDTRLSETHLRLHCAPAVNLYEQDAEPISVDHTQSDYRVNPERQCAEYTSIYRVDSVTSRDQGTGETYAYYPLHAMRYRSDSDRVYATHQRITGSDHRLTYLRLNSPVANNPEVISVEAMVTNDQYPRRYLDVGSLDKLSSQLSRILTVTNITRPTKALTTPSFQDYQWQLVSLLSLSLSSLESIDNIKQLLSLFDWTDQLENKKRIDSISGVQTRITHRLKRGVLFQGLEVRIELAEQGFSSPSDMYMFGAVLHHFFSAFANMTEFVQTKIVRLPSYKEWVWNPVFGSKTLF